MLGYALLVSGGRPKSAFLVRAYEARVTNHVGGQDGSETALHS